jgi:hypothetical protein
MTMRAVFAKLLLLLLDGIRGGGLLRGGRLGEALLVLVNAASGIDKLLRARVERVANVANADQQRWLDGLRLDHIAACATDLGVLILRMNICSHNKGRRHCPQVAGLTSGIFQKLCVCAIGAAFSGLSGRCNSDESNPARWAGLNNHGPLGRWKSAESEIKRRWQAKELTKDWQTNRRSAFFAHGFAGLN